MNDSLDSKTKNELSRGTIAYDLSQLEPVVIVDPDVGTVAEQSDAQRDLIENNAGNKAVGYTPDTRCVEVQFFSMQSVNDKQFTYPETRLGVPALEIGDERFSVREYIEFQTLQSVLAEASRLGEKRLKRTAEVITQTGQYANLMDSLSEQLDEDLDSYS